MIRIKENVELWHRQRDGLLIVPSVACCHIIDKAHDIWIRNGAERGELWITSVFNGRHTRLSEHYQGNAVDLRTRNLPGGYLGQAAHKCATELWQALGADYTVILEADHVHAHHEPGAGGLIIEAVTV